MAANAIIPCDAGCGNTTLQGTLHSILSFPFFLGSIAVMYLLIGPFANDQRWRPLRRAVLVIAVYASVTMLALFAWRAAGIASWGMVQRLNVIGLLAFYALVANQLRSLSARG
jgi:cytochrome c oxidase assembly factor CtaG